MKNSIVKNLVIGILLLAITFFALLPLFHAGIFTMHDDEQIGRLQQMFLVLSQGQVPPRWVPDLGFGFGYPLFNFYPPLVYYMGSFFHLIGFSYINSTKIVFGLGFFLAAIAMFAWVKKHFGIVAGFFAAILYTYAPYHSVDSYVRGALSEFFSWIFVPLIFLSLDLLVEKKEKKYIVALGLSFGLLMLSHTLVMLQFGPLLPVYLLFLFVQKKNRDWKTVLYICLGFAFGLGLTAYFWLPSLLEKQYTLVDAILTTQLANYAIHFVCPVQLWSGIWGYGGSVAGCVDGLSFQIGKIQAIVGGIGVLCSIFLLFKKRRLGFIAIAVLFLCSIFLTLSYSKFLWDIAKPFWYIQFPWRYLLFVAVFASFLGGFVISLIEKKFGKWIALGVMVVLSALAIFQVRNDFQPQAYRMVSDAQMTSPQALQEYVSSLSYEYVPEEVATRLSPQKTTELAIDKNQLPTNSFTALSPNMKVVRKENLSTLKKYIVNVYNTKTQKSGILQINTYLFPGWEVLIDGRKVNGFVANKLDLIQVQIPEGEHTVTAQFENTPIRTIANTISIVSMVSLIGFAFFKSKKHI